MHQQIVVLFQHGISAVLAVQILNDYGCKAADIDLVAPTPETGLKDPEAFRIVYARQLLEQPAAMWPCALRWGIAGSLLVENPS